MTHSSGLLRSVINAWGTPTPYGVSRSDAAVAHAAADILQRHGVMSELQTRTGRAALVAAVDAQHGGIGRAMKPTEEALAGVLAALQARTLSGRGDWLAAQQRKVAALAESLAGWPGVQTYRESDPLCGGFERLWLAIDPDITGVDAAAMAQRLRDADPVIAVAPHRVAQGQVGLELSGVDDSEMADLCAGLQRALVNGTGT